jgi:hypothetical protein
MNLGAESMKVAQLPAAQVGHRELTAIYRKGHGIRLGPGHPPLAVAQCRKRGYAHYLYDLPQSWLREPPLIISTPLPPASGASTESPAGTKFDGVEP